MRMKLADAGMLVHEAGMVIIGERHGTTEFPNLVLELATSSAHRGRLIVALELGDDAEGPTASFVESGGLASDLERLLGAPSWQRQDGRASVAMLSLVEGIRCLVHAGALIEAAVFDATPVGDPRSDGYQIQRERLLADGLREIGTHGPTLALTGNAHAELVPRPDAPPMFVPAAAQVAEHTTLVALVGQHAGGEAWCTLPIDGQLVSAPHPVKGNYQGDQAFIEVAPSAFVRPGAAYVGAISPSPPAVRQR